uniref:Putative secreted peptide n=1 Tax=Anopheles braziliensis TaxID=58242 RepID=A0A2M3ZP85_9DIPT
MCPFLLFFSLYLSHSHLQCLLPARLRRRQRPKRSPHRRSCTARMWAPTTISTWTSCSPSCHRRRSPCWPRRSTRMTRSCHPASVRTTSVIRHRPGRSTGRS